MAQLREGVSFSLPVPDVSYLSDASIVSWGALIGEHHAWSLGSPHQKTLNINLRELLAVQFGLRALELLLVDLSVALFCDNTTTVTCVRLLPRFIMGSSNVTADALSSPI